MGIPTGPYFTHLTDNYDYGVKKEMSPAPIVTGIIKKFWRKNVSKRMSRRNNWGARREVKYLKLLFYIFFGIFCISLTQERFATEKTWRQGLWWWTGLKPCGIFSSKKFIKKIILTKTGKNMFVSLRGT